MNEFFRIVKALCDENGNLPEVLTIQGAVIEKLTSLFLDSQEDLTKALQELSKRNNQFIQLSEQYEAVLFEFENYKDSYGVEYEEN